MQEQSYKSQNNTETIKTNIYSSIFDMIKTYKWKMIGSIVFGTISSFLVITPFFLVYLIISDFINGDLTPDTLLNYGLLMLGLSFGRAFTFSMSTKISHLISAYVMSDIRIKIGKKLQNIPMGFFGENDSQSIQKMVTDDVEAMEDGIAHMIPEMTSSIIPPIVVIIGMFYINWILSIGSVIGIFIGFWQMSRSMKKSADNADTYYKINAEIANESTELISCLPVIKIFNEGKDSFSKIEKTFNKTVNLIKKWLDETMDSMQWFMLLSTSNLVFVLPVAILVYLYTDTPINELAFFLIMASYMNVIIIKFYGFVHRFHTQKNIHSRVRSFLSEDEIIYKKNNNKPEKYNITLENVKFSYDKKTILNGINLEIKQGTGMALVGESGAGKSTIAKLLPRFWDVDSGSIKIGGVDIRDMSEYDLSQCMSFVFQETFLFSQTIRENLLIAKQNATQQELERVCKKAQIHDFIKSLEKGYDTKINIDTKLSGGQKQRLCIARAILKDAPILILDEATSFTDPENEAMIQKAITNLVQDKTLIVIAHRLNTIINLDKIAVVENGKIIECDSHKNLLLKKGRYTKMWDSYKISQKFILGEKV